MSEIAPSVQADGREARQRHLGWVSRVGAFSVKTEITSSSKACNDVRHDVSESNGGNGVETHRRIRVQKCEPRRSNHLLYFTNSFLADAINFQIYTRRNELEQCFQSNLSLNRHEKCQTSSIHTSLAAFLFRNVHSKHKFQATCCPVTSQRAMGILVTASA